MARCYPVLVAPWTFGVLRASGGIGRRARFRSVCPQGRGGSTPPSRTLVLLRNGLRICVPGVMGVTGVDGVARGGEMWLR
jgi:hypothetical protein